MTTYLANAAAAFLQRTAFLVDLSLEHAVKDALYERRDSRQRLSLLLLLYPLTTSNLAPCCRSPDHVIHINRRVLAALLGQRLTFHSPPPAPP